MKELVDQHQLCRLHAVFGTHTVKTGTTDLELGNTHRILIRHPQRQVTRYSFKQTIRAARIGVLYDDGLQKRQVLTGIGRILIISHTRNTRSNHRMDRRREGLAHLRFQIGQPGVESPFLGLLLPLVEATR